MAWCPTGTKPLREPMMTQVSDKYVYYNMVQEEVGGQVNLTRMWNCLPGLGPTSLVAITHFNMYTLT